MEEKATNPYLTPLAIVISGIFVAGALYFSGGQGGEGQVAQVGDQGPQEVQEPRPIGEDDHVRGADEAKISVIEYSDFQCPFCSRFHSTMQQVLSSYSDVAWVYRHFPLTQIHPEALPAAIASECIAKLGGNDAFWTFADSIFANQSNMNTDVYNTLSQNLGISQVDFEACLSDDAAVARVRSDAENAVSLGARGTPFSLIVDEDGDVLASIPGALPFDQVKPVIERALSE